MSKKILILPGDGIGNEVMAEVLKIIDWMEKTKSLSFDISERLVGGTAYDKEGNSISDETMQVAMDCDAVLFGAVGGAKWDNVERDKRPCLLYTSPSPRDDPLSRMPSSA